MVSDMHPQSPLGKKIALHVQSVSCTAINCIEGEAYSINTRITHGLTVYLKKAKLVGASKYNEILPIRYAKAMQVSNSVTHSLLTEEGGLVALSLANARLSTVEDTDLVSMYGLDLSKWPRNALLLTFHKEILGASEHHNDQKLRRLLAAGCTQKEMLLEAICRYREAVGKAIDTDVYPLGSNPMGKFLEKISTL